MNLGGLLSFHVRRLPFRARLAVAFSGLFLLAGTALLVFVVLLARRGTAQKVQVMDILPMTDAMVPDGAHRTGQGGTGSVPSWNPADVEGIAIRKTEQTIQAVQDTALQEMVTWSGIGLVVMALLAGLLGWWLAGRALRPITAMTESARRISDHNLYERLALAGPDDELHRLADTFDTMLDRLEKAFDSQRRFVANASHELRTPLAVQRASIEVGLADPLPDGLGEVRDDLLAANRDAEKLIAALLLLARSDRGLSSTEPVGLNSLARQARAELAALAKEKQVEVTVTGPDGDVVGDPVLLRHLLTNLIGNAIRYNHRGGHVHVRLEGGTLTVTNSGPEVPPDRVDDLFEPFRRLAQDRLTHQSGHGLGLSIVRSIAEAHGARTNATAGAEGGLRISIVFNEESTTAREPAPLIGSILDQVRFLPKNSGAVHRADHDHGVVVRAAEREPPTACWPHLQAPNDR
ncbi:MULTISPECIES: HAMP domain-containing sensor histidine kinase [Streptomyces]|jgi:signal transduction histidine kinase|uniref:sensor histidine kinase n=1 Tax=Streptomyces TaxID=1883 RepID=UPI00288978AF|nr:HAMP domain-containing sensor histidine kinase [Streptomyces sp. DSM 41636]